MDGDVDVRTLIVRNNRKLSAAVIDSHFKDYSLYQSVYVDPNSQLYHKATFLLQDTSVKGNLDSSSEKDAMDEISVTESLYVSPEKRLDFLSGTKQLSFPIEGDSNLSNLMKSLQFKMPAAYDSNEAATVSYSNTPAKRMLTSDRRDLKPGVDDESSTPSQRPSSSNTDQSLNPKWRHSYSAEESPSRSKSSFNKLVPKVSNLMPASSFPVPIVEIKVFREKTAPVTMKIMVFLIEDFRKKEESFFNILNLLKKKESCDYPMKVLMLFQSWSDVMKQSYKIEADLFEKLEIVISDKLPHGIENGDSREAKKLAVNVVFQESEAWCCMKIKFICNMKLKTVTAKSRIVNPANIELKENTQHIKSFLNVVFGGLNGKFENYYEGWSLKVEFITIDMNRDQNGPCPSYDSGISIYKRLCKDYLKLSGESIDREHIFFMMIEKYYSQGMV